MIPLFKGKRDKSNPSNYRPIGLTVIACKILESIIVAQTRDYLENNKLMCPQQHGFMSQQSTLSNLLLCDELIAQYLNDRKPCDLFLLDFTRAFDKVSHSILLNKLISLGKVVSSINGWLTFFVIDLNLSRIAASPRNRYLLNLESNWGVWPWLAPNFSTL